MIKMKSQSHLKWFALVLLLSVFTTLSAADERHYELGPNGEISQCLFLGFIPIKPEGNSWEKAFNSDLLATVGGEASQKPVGGQRVKLPQGELVWKLAQFSSPEMIARKDKFLRIMFVSDNGNPVEQSAVYLFCRILSQSAVDGFLLLGRNDSVKVFLNGKEIHRFIGEREVIEDSDKVPIHLNAGFNDLTVRVDNYASTSGFCGRLTDSEGAPLKSIRISIQAEKDAPVLRSSTYYYPGWHHGSSTYPSWSQVISEIPPVPAVPNQELFGARLARTMSLLETGGITHRPVRILFYGQSITQQEWTTLLVRRLRELYPETKIEAINLAIAGYSIDIIYRTLKHDILRARPDLVCFHAYSGTHQQWEQIVQNIRRETCADIILKTSHLTAAMQSEPEDVQQTQWIRLLAQEYNCELVEVRKEWTNYLKQNKLTIQDFLADGVHLNRKGCVLMAQLYERHFRTNTLSPAGWTDRVRYYQADRPFTDRKMDEINYTGDGWKPNSEWVESSSPKDAMSLAFTGNRVDVILAPCHGSAKILIDDVPPSQMNLYHGTFPQPQPGKEQNCCLLTYYTGKNMLGETWGITFTDASDDLKKFRYKVEGSRTGPDGEGDSEHEFVSKSGRISISPKDMSVWPAAISKTNQPPSTELKRLEKEAKLIWPIVPDSSDVLRITSATRAEILPQACTVGRYESNYNCVTVADGLPFGKHKITIIPTGDGPVSIRGIEVYSPPLAPKK